MKKKPTTTAQVEKACICNLADSNFITDAHQQVSPTPTEKLKQTEYIRKLCLF